MGRKPSSCQETNIERASRVRENKRRHRARRKEYVSDLERRLAETREQGVQVTHEVQLAAQRVTRENAKLRDLLRRTGYTDEVIGAWIREDGCLHGVGRPQPVLRQPSGETVLKGTPACATQRRRTLNARNISVKDRELGLVTASEDGECLTRVSPRSVESRIEKLNGAPTERHTEICTNASSLSGYQDSTIVPCKLLTLLAKDPTADITQVSLSTQSDTQPCEASMTEACSSGGIECSTAYKMLMQYATSDKKMDKIAMALESGCTLSAAGGCNVKKSVIWAVLDEECT
ncbi:hypothetical protein B0J11DRAFT_542600 [Dendryphion nanum]|uniref:BZIP domain-containing protein n=1 Tax=Dendryphion nanum TaxID=256645 RepID=A0A9P9D4Y4_9PLEO|nr:hypothetical protein B0J11DRAFT_542600 [Dendryphion nanum]